MICLFRTSGKSWTVRELAQRYYLSERQVRRDVAEIMGDPDYAPLVIELRFEYRIMETCY
jgi:predicted DNA-binding transcriptional regulator YafY